MPEDIYQRTNKLKIKAALRHNIKPDFCHIGHIALEGFLEKPNNIAQIDAVTNVNETNGSVARRTMRLASAMRNFGLKPADPVIIMGPNHLDICIPYYACHFMGYSMCSIDPMNSLEDLKILYGVIRPKMIFTQKDCLENNQAAVTFNNLDTLIVTFDDKQNDMEGFIQQNKGTEVGYSPAVGFDVSTVPAWLILTSGTTGVPKVAMIPFDTLLHGICEWWAHLKKEDISLNMTLTSTQWLTALVFFISTPVKGFTRLQASQATTPQIMVHAVNTYRPEFTAWTPYLLARFVQSPQKVLDLSCFKHILVGGSAMEKHIVDEFRKICPATLHLCYGMSELLTPIFIYTPGQTPFGSSGIPNPRYQFKLISDEGEELEEVDQSGELWVKGKGTFFSGYLSNKEETASVLTDDGWFKTGDIFRRDTNNEYYFVERKRLLIRYDAHWVSPLLLEVIIKRHPGVAEACVVGLPNPATVEVPVAAIARSNGHAVNPEEIFNMIKAELPDYKHLKGGLFFIDAFPLTPSGKIHRKKVLEMAKEAQRIMPSS